MIVVRDGEKVGRVGIAHWWPYRNIWWEESFSPFPSYIRNRAYKMRSKYMTMARVSLPEGELATYAVCRANDQPNRAKGRFIALLRMARLLKSMGLKMEKA